MAGTSTKLALLGILCSAVAAGWPAAGRSEAAAGGPWQVERSATMCGLRHAPAGENGIILDYEYHPGSGTGELILRGKGRRQVLGGLGKSVSVKVLPDGREETGKLVMVDGRSWITGGLWKGIYWKIADLDPEFIGAMHGAEWLELQRDGKSLLRVPLQEADAAVAEFRGCVDDHLRSWGVDPALLAALQEQPHTELWLSPADYPSRVSAHPPQGDVVTRMTIDAAGRVTGCAVVVPAWFEDLNRVTCELALRKGRFSPAIGADGQPTPLSFIFHAVWLAD